MTKAAMATVAMKVLVSVEPGCYSAPVLELAGHALDYVALTVDLPFVVDLDFAVRLRGDDRRCAAPDQRGTQGVAAIALVGDQILGRRNGIDR